MSEIHVSIGDNICVHDSLSIAMIYKPAGTFATKAIHWRDRALAQQPKPPAAGTDEGELALIFAAVALESFIAEEIVTRLPGEAESLLAPRLSVLARWTQATQRLTTATPSAQAAYGEIRQQCTDRGDYGLLARARNKLIHPRMHTETIDDATGHSIDHQPIRTLVADLRRLKLPEINPVFPHLIKNSRFAAYSVGVMHLMIMTFYRALDRSLPDEWSAVLAAV